METNRKTARIAGLLFLLMVVVGLFAELFFRQKLVAADAATTAQNILNNPMLLRAGVLSDIVMSLSYLFTALALYRLLRSVDRDLASLMVLLAAAGSVILLVNTLFEFLPLVLVNLPAGALSAEQLQELAQIGFVANANGYMIGQVFFALWVLPLGLLICRSKFIPKVLGILFIIETVCGLLAVAAHFLLGGGAVVDALLTPGTVAEFALLAFLLIRGVNTPKKTTTVTA
ncbi:MAG: DUF4386 domain-containing protein [Christensenella sp.]|nr:DUF4386 domain-containing protein [Christensenella sp.]